LEERKFVRQFTKKSFRHYGKTAFYVFRLSSKMVPILLDLAPYRVLAGCRTSLGQVPPSLLISLLLCQFYQKVGKSQWNYCKFFYRIYMKGEVCLLFPYIRTEKSPIRLQSILWGKFILYTGSHSTRPQMHPA